MVDMSDGDLSQALCALTGGAQGGRREARNPQLLRRLADQFELPANASHELLRETVVDLVGTEPRVLADFQKQVWRALFVQNQSFSTASRHLHQSDRSVKRIFENEVAPVVAGHLQTMITAGSETPRTGIRETNLGNVLDRLEYLPPNHREPANTYLIDEAGWALRAYHGEDPLTFAGRVYPCVVLLGAHEFVPVNRVSLRVTGGEPFALDSEVTAGSESAFVSFLSHLNSIGSHFYNGVLGRLADVGRTRTGVELSFEAAHYKDVVRSSIVIDHAPEEAMTVRQRFLVTDDGSLPPLGESRAANALGLDGILVTTDRRVILTTRSARVAVSPSQVNVSFSGDTDFTDVEHLIHLSLDVLLRELHEELGIDRFAIEQKDSGVLGLTRDLVRGGKPHLHLFAVGKISSDEVHERWRIAHSKDEGTGDWSDCELPDGVHADLSPQPELQDEIGRWLEELIAKHGRSLSVRTGATLALWASVKSGIRFPGID